MVNMLDAVLALRKLANHWNTVHGSDSGLLGMQQTAVVLCSETDEQQIRIGAHSPHSLQCPFA